MATAEDRYRVYTQGIKGLCLKEIDPEYVYMTIPKDYVCIYRKLITMLSQFGVDLLNDCSATCKGNNKTIINCWHMFLAAIAAHQLGDEKTANVLMNYIKGQVNLIYSNNPQYKQFEGNIILPIDETGHLKALVGCGETSKFYVDLETGNLYEQQKENSHEVFTVNENNLNVDSND